VNPRNSWTRIVLRARKTRVTLFVNAPGRHYTLKSAMRALQLLDLTCTAFRKIAKSAPKLRKLG
jgi:hypothetical protein